MPMFDNGFKWRPNDNSSKTNHRYSLEAEKWVNAVSAAQRKAQPRSISKDLMVIGMVLQLILNLILLILIGILTLFKSIIYFIESKSTGNKIVNTDNLSGVTVRFGGDRTLINYIFYNRYEELRMLWKFCYFAILILFAEVVTFYILGQIWPEHFRIYRDSLLFAAGVSVFFAFTGLDN